MSIFHHKKWLILGLSLLTGIYAEAQQTGAVTNRAPNPTPGMMPGQGAADAYGMMPGMGMPGGYPGQGPTAAGGYAKMRFLLLEAA